jgi:hypothetical protein
MKRRLHEWRKDLFQTHLGGLNGTIYFAKAFTSDTAYFITTDPQCIKHILKDNFNNYSKDGPTSVIFGLLRQWLGKGIFTIRHGTAPVKSTVA